MPALGASGPNIATVAYVQIDGATGTATSCNSGVVVSRPTGFPAGAYMIVLPQFDGDAESSDLIFVEARNASGGVSTSVFDVSALEKQINCYDSASDLTDADLTVVMFRVALPSAVHAPRHAPHPPHPPH